MFTQKLSHFSMTALAAAIFISLCASREAGAQTVGRIDTFKGVTPYNLAANANSNRVYVTAFWSDNLSVIDGNPKSKNFNKVVATLQFPAGSHPLGVAVNPTTNLVYVAHFDGKAVTVINGGSNKVITTINLNSATNPDLNGNPDMIAVNPATNRVYVTDYTNARVWTIDGATNRVIATTPVGVHPVFVAANSTTNLVYVGNVDSNTVSVIDGRTSVKVQDIAVGAGPVGVAVNPETNLVYVANANDPNLDPASDPAKLGSLSIIDGSPGSPRYHTVVKTVQNAAFTGTAGTTDARFNYPFGLAVDQVTEKVYVANYMGNTVTTLDGETGAFVSTVAVGKNPWSVAVNNATRYAYVANYGDSTVSVINPAPITLAAAQ
jgi:YVTN family beta-propeller protein